MAHRREIFLDSDEEEEPLAARIKRPNTEIVILDDSDDSLPASQVTVIHITPSRHSPAECIQISSESLDGSRPAGSPSHSPDSFYHQSPEPFYDSPYRGSPEPFTEQRTPVGSPEPEPEPEARQQSSPKPSHSKPKPASPPRRPPSPEPVLSQPCSQSSQVTTQSSQPGRAPARAISSRDCSAVVPVNIFGKFFSREELQKACSEFEVRFTECSSSKFANTITWNREKIDDATGVMSTEAENQVLVLLKMDQTVKMVDQYLRRLHNGFKAHEFISLEGSETEFDQLDIEEGSVDFEEFTKTISLIYPRSSIILLVTGMPAYFRRLKNKEQQKFRDAIRGTQQARKRKSVGLPVIKEKDLIDASVDLDMKSSHFMPVGCHVCVMQADKSDEIVTIIASICKSVAEAPYKRQQKEMRNMAWYAENDSKFAVDIKDIPQDIERLWKKQLEQFPKVSREVADGIAKVYPNPLSLIEAYILAPIDSRASLLENIKVGKGSRRVGHEISRKICSFFNSETPDEFL